MSALLWFRNGCRSSPASVRQNRQQRPETADEAFPRDRRDRAETNCGADGTRRAIDHRAMVSATRRFTGGRICNAGCTRAAEPQVVAAHTPAGNYRRNHLGTRETVRRRQRDHEHAGSRHAMQSMPTAQPDAHRESRNPAASPVAAGTRLRIRPDRQPGIGPVHHARSAGDRHRLKAVSSRNRTRSDAQARGRDHDPVNLAPASRQQRRRADRGHPCTRRDQQASASCCADC